MKTRSILSKSLACGALALLLFPATFQSAGAAIYMKFEGGSEPIKGNSTAEGFTDYIEVQSFQWGVGRSVSNSIGSGASREASKPSFSEITVTRASDELVPIFMASTASGHAYTKVTIAFVATGGSQPSATPYLTYELKNVLISGYSLSSGGDRPSESLSLNYTAVQITSVPLDKDGKPGTPIVRKWDIMKNVSQFSVTSDAPFEPSSPPAITGTTIDVKP